MDTVEILGAPVTDYVTMLGATSPQDLACAEKVKAPLYTAAGCTVSTVGLGLFGVYKLFKGKPAAGVTGFVAAALTLGLGRVLATSAALQFKNCQAGGPTGIT